jgi:hypothetical protein
MASIGGSSHGNSSSRSLALIPRTTSVMVVILHMGHNEIYIMFMSALNLFGVVSSHNGNCVGAASPKASIP